MSSQTTVSIQSPTGHFVSNNTDEDGFSNITRLSVPIILDSQQLQTTRFIVQRIFVPLIVVGGIIGNAFNIVVLNNPKMRSSTNVYLMSLAVSDSMYLIFCLTLAFSHCSNIDQSANSFYYIPYGRVMADFFGNNAVWLTVAFTLERYVGVCHPMKGKAWCTIGKAKVATVIALTICLINTVPEMFELEIAEIVADSADGSYYKCRMTQFAEKDSYQIGYYWWYVTLFTFIPLTLLSVFNSLLIRSVWDANRKRKVLSNSSVVGENLRQSAEQQKVTTMLITVVVIFLFCQIPGAILLLYKAHLSANNIPPPINAIRIAGNICNLLVLLNSSVNFLLYSYFSSRFRRTFRSIFCAWKKYKRKRTMNSVLDGCRKSSSGKDSTTATSVSSVRPKRGGNDVITSIVHEKEKLQKC